MRPKRIKRTPSGLSYTTTLIGNAMGVTGRTVYGWCQSGLMPASVIPGQRRLRIRQRDAESFAAKHGLKFDRKKLS